MAEGKAASAPPGSSVRFLCDAMLGGLAKWLRAAGYDAYYAREGTDVSDRTLTAKALRERRVLLTSSGSWSNTSGSSGARAAAWCAVGDWRLYPARSSRVWFLPAY